MKKLFLLLLFPTVLLAQISGQVLSATDRKPVGFASVFINNSTLGTTADENGRFSLSRLQPGKHELVVSIVGYEKFMTVITSPSSKPIEIFIKEKDQMLDPVLVKAFDKDGWQTWNKLFLETFIGTTENSTKTKLLNPKDLRFRHDKKNNILEVYALAPLRIRNSALGYDLEYHLEIFEVNFRHQTQVYAGYPFFKDRKVGKKELKNRQNTYDASLTKFFRSLYHNTLQKDGYLVRRLVEVKNKEKERIQKIYDKYTIKETGANGSLIVIGRPALPEDIYTSDSLQHFSKILAQPSSSMSLYKDTLSRSQILKRDAAGLKYIQFDEYLHVVNSLHKEEKKYLEYRRENRNIGPQTSLLKLVENTPVEIQSNGNYFPPLNLLTSDYWGWSNKIADLLPLDYLPNSSTP